MGTKMALEKAASRTIRQAADCAVTGRNNPAWLEQQLKAIEDIGLGNVDRGLALYIAGLQEERDALIALETQMNHDR